MTHLQNTQEEEDLLIDDVEEDSITKKYGNITWFSEIFNTFIYVIGILAIAGFIWVIGFLSSRYGDFGLSFDSKWEKMFTTSNSKTSCQNSLNFLARNPNYVGVNRNENFNFMKEKLEEFIGKDHVKIEKYQVLASYPTQNTNSIILSNQPENITIQLNLFEPIVQQDNQTRNSQLYQAWSAYSGSGILNNRDIVYVNFGSDQDFEFLVSINVDLKEKILLARYSKENSGFVAKNAEFYGASGLILFTDPADEKIDKQPSYPNGQNRADFSIRRSSMSYFTQTYPGDPTTPGVPSIVNTARRISRDEAKSIPKKIFIVLPISAQEARKVMLTLNGTDAPSAWIGGLNVPYKIGDIPSNYKTTMNVDLTEGLVEISNIIVTIPGNVEPDRTVIIGSKRDSFVYGASQPVSGMASFLEIAKSVGKLLRNDWVPRRNLILASWDASDLSLIGSTEWIEQYTERLSSQVIAYFNIDGNTGSHFKVESSSLISALIKSQALRISSPITNVNLLRYWEMQTPKTQPKVDLLSTTSDHSGFIFSLGIPSASVSFSGVYGTKGSLYDTIYNYENIIDRNYTYCTSISNVVGLSALRLVHNSIIPYNLTEHSLEIRDSFQNFYFSKLFYNYTQSLNADIRFFNKIYQFNETISKYGTLVNKFYEKLDKLSKNDQNYELKLRSLNDKLLSVERGFINSQGLYYSPFYKHVLYGPLSNGTSDYYPSLKSSMMDLNHQKVIISLEQILQSFEVVKQMIQ